MDVSRETRDKRHSAQSRRGSWRKEPSRKEKKALRTLFTGQQRAISVGKGQKLCPAHHRSMESPGKYSLYPQRSQGGIWSYQAATCFVPLDRTGVPSSFRLTWTAAEIQQETELPGPRCAMWTWGVEEGRKKEGGKWAGQVFIPKARKELDEFWSVD